jgi:hypothetical protein
MREARGDDSSWIKQIEDTLKQRARQLEGDKSLS